MGQQDQVGDDVAAKITGAIPGTMDDKIVDAVKSMDADSVKDVVDKVTDAIPGQMDDKIADAAMGMMEGAGDAAKGATKAGGGFMSKIMGMFKRS